MSRKWMLSPMLLTPSPGHLKQCRGRYDMKRKTAQIRAGLPKRVKMRGVGMPQL